MVPGSPIRFPPWPVLFVPALFLAVGCGEGPSGTTALALGARELLGEMERQGLP